MWPLHYKTVKPIFHWKWGSRWAPNANEIYTKNMKCTCPTPAPMSEGPTPPIFHWLASGVGVGANANFKFGVGENANFSIFRYQHGIPNAKKSGVGGLSQRQGPTQLFCVAVEYRLKCSIFTNIYLHVFIFKCHNPAPCVHILAAGCMDFKPCAPGVCMYFQHY